MKNARRGEKRWQATVRYRSKVGTVPVVHEIEELDELQNLVEHGPDWHAISGIEIVLTRNPWPELTIEEADTRTHAQAMASMKASRKVQ